MKKNTRKQPCELCSANTGCNHKIGCFWRDNPRPTKQVKNLKLSFVDRIKIIYKLIWN